MQINNVEQIRKIFGEGDAKRDEGLKTPENIQRVDNITYGEHGEWNLLDVYHEKCVVKDQPTIINIHGGGWVYGTKEVYQFYCMNLAQRGFTVINFNYRLAPEHPFPAALEDINEVFNWVLMHGKEYHIDVENLFVVGDSAGAQLGSQYTAMLTNEKYQSLFEFKVPSDKIKIKAVAFNCGVYDTRKYLETSEDGIFQSYIGTKKEEKIPFFDTMKYVSKAFPPSFIMTSYHDFLRENAKPMYDALTALDIPCEYRLYGSEDREDIGHVFHLNIRLEEAKLCNDEECAFLKRCVKE